MDGPKYDGFPSITSDPLFFSDPTFYKWGKKIMICDPFFLQILPNLHNLHLLITWLFYIAISN